MLPDTGRLKMARCLSVLLFGFVVLVYSQDLLPLYLGCYEDKPTRDLESSEYITSTNTPAKCIDRCVALNYTFAAVQFSQSCYCGNTYGRYGQRPTSECNMACKGDSNIKCGGSWRNSIYCIVPFHKQFLGCYKESIPRDLWGLETAGDVRQCREICQSEGYAYAAVQNNSRCTCTCGVSYGRYGKADPFACNCGNNNAVYKTGGTWKMTEIFYGNSQQSPPLTSRHVVYFETSVDQLYLCASYCETNPLCKSINYNHLTLVCEMNKVTSSEGESKARAGFEYYEPLGQILNLDIHKDL